jgi:hypothetical protein
MCEYHLSALANIKQAFKDWSEALEIEWEEYLHRLEQVEGVGKWVIEVIEHLNSQDASSGRT